MRYKNTSSTSQCIYSKDLSEHPLRHALRVYDRTGKNIEYSGILADVSYSYASVTEVPEDYYSPSAYYILPPGDELISHFSVTKNYQIKPNEKYTVRYTIPVTPCSAIANGLKEIPSAYQPFFVEPAFRLADNDSDWAQRLEIHTEAWPNWASVGFWAEMEPVEFQFEG